MTSEQSHERSDVSAGEFRWLAVQSWIAGVLWTFPLTAIGRTFGIPAPITQAVGFLLMGLSLYPVLRVWARRRSRELRFASFMLPAVAAIGVLTAIRILFDF